jgi:hypothetical protein
MTAGKVDFVSICGAENSAGACEQGSTFQRVLFHKNADGTAINLTGYTARMQVRKFVNSADVTLSLTTENGRLVIDPLLGKITMTISAADTTTLPVGCYVYDLELVSGSFVKKLIYGGLHVVGEVTR